MVPPLISKEEVGAYKAGTRFVFRRRNEVCLLDRNEFHSTRTGKGDDISDIYEVVAGLLVPSCAAIAVPEKFRQEGSLKIHLPHVRRPY